MKKSLAVAALVALTAAPVAAFTANEFFSDIFGSSEEVSEGVLAIGWDDLSPELSEEAAKIIEASGDDLNEDLDGEQVAISGFIVPFNFEDTKATTFVLAPYVGACIHVPAPPANQIIFIDYPEGLEMDALLKNFYNEFRLVGTLEASPIETDLAEIGYRMKADKVIIGGL